MENCKLVSTPMITRCNPCSKDDSPMVNQPEYRSMIGSLLYLTGIDQTLCMQLGLLDDSKLIQKSLTFRLSKEYSNIYKELKTLDYGIPGMLISLFMHIEM